MSASSRLQSGQDAREDEQVFVTIKVGKNHRPFRIKMHLLCNASEFFKKAFQSNFKEGLEREMILEDTDEDVFKAASDFFKWGCLPCNEMFLDYDNYDWDNDWDSRAGQVDCDFIMSGLYVFAVTYLVDSLAQVLLRKFTSRLERNKHDQTHSIQFPAAASVTRLFDNVPDDSPLCELLVKTFVESAFSRRFVIKPYVDGLNEMPVGFTTAVQEAFASGLDEVEDELVHKVRITCQFSKSISPAEPQDREKSWIEVIEERVEASLGAKMTDQAAEIEKLKKKIEELKMVAEEGKDDD